MIEIDRERAALKTHSLTHFIIIGCLLFFGISAVVGVCFLLFTPFYAVNFIVTGAMIFSCLLIYGIATLLKWLSVFIHKKCEAKKSTQMRNEMLIGLGVIASCGIVLRLSVFFVKFDDNFLCGTLFLLCAVSIALYHFFIYEWDKNSYDSDLHLHANEKAYLIFFALQASVLYVTYRSVIDCDLSRADKEKLIFTQVILALFCGMVTFDLYDVLSGKRKLKHVDGMLQPAGNAGILRRESVRVAPKAEQVSRLTCEDCKNRKSQAAQTHPKIDCKVCRVEYSYTRIPRNLKECGHTICELCADTLLKKNQQLFLLCPFCKVATAVNGPASMLQKSYGILEILNDLKN